MELQRIITNLQEKRRKLPQFNEIKKLREQRQELVAKKRDGTWTPEDKAQLKEVRGKLRKLRSDPEFQKIRVQLTYALDSARESDEGLMATRPEPSKKFWTERVEEIDKNLAKLREARAKADNPKDANNIQNMIEDQQKNRQRLIKSMPPNEREWIRIHGESQNALEKEKAKLEEKKQKSSDHKDKVDLDVKLGAIEDKLQAHKSTKMSRDSMYKEAQEAEAKQSAAAQKIADLTTTIEKKKAARDQATDEVTRNKLTEEIAADEQQLEAVENDRDQAESDYDKSMEDAADLGGLYAETAVRDIAPPWIRWAQAGNPLIDQVSDAISTAMNGSAGFAAQVDAAVQSAQSQAAQIGGQLHQAMQKGRSRGRGMINQLLQVLAMSRSR
ncbi:MAG: hypothetical protein R3C68_02230 [Myxococcota bacterium]